MDILVAVLSALAGLFLYQAFNKNKSSKDQAELEAKVKELQDKEKEILAGNEEEKRKTEEKVDEINKEQNTELNGNSLADWFNKRKD